MKFAPKLAIYYLAVVLTALLITGFFVIQSIETHASKSMEEEIMGKNDASLSYIRQQVFAQTGEGVDDLWDSLANPIAETLSQNTGSEVRIYNNKMDLLSCSVDGVLKQESELGKIDKNKELLKHALKGETVYIIKNGKIYAASPIVMFDKTVGIFEFVTDMKLVNNVITGVKHILYIGAIIFSVTIIVLSFFIAGRVVKPLNELVEATRQYSKHNFVTLSIKRKDEFGILASSFNDMGNRIQDYVKKQKQFVSNVSHELRTPLTAIKGYSEYLNSEIEGNEDIEEALFHLKNESLRLENMVNELLLLSKIDSGNDSFENYSLNLSQLVEEIVANSKFKADKHNIEIRLALTDQDIFIESNREKLIPVIVNVLDNAIKFSSNGGFVDINLGLLEEASYIEIIDYGIGICDKDKDSIFERFYRAENAKGVTGTGLGLNIVKDILERLGGSIEIDSKLGVGTQVRIYLKR